MKLEGMWNEFGINSADILHSVECVRLKKP